MVIFMVIFVDMEMNVIFKALFCFFHLNTEGVGRMLFFSFIVYRFVWLISKFNVYGYFLEFIMLLLIIGE